MATKTKRPKIADPGKGVLLVSTGQQMTARQWRKFEQVGLRPELDLDDLVLNWTERKVKDLEAKGAITGIQIESTIDAAPSVTVVLRDPDRMLFRRNRGRTKRRKPTKAQLPLQVDEGWDPILPPDVFGRPMQISLDGVTYQLVKVAYNTDSTEAQLTFEHEFVYLMRRHRGAKRAPRGKVTRAQFILSMALELAPEIYKRRYRFVCPELNVRQAIERQAKQTQTPVTATSSGGGGGRSLNRVFPAQSGGGGERLSVDEVRACAAAGGFWGRELTVMEQIAHGESNYRPGAQNMSGDGGTGMWQMTPYLLLQGGRANWGAAAIGYMNKLGGVKAMRNPIQNAKMARYLYEAAGKAWTPWFGTQYVTDFSGGPGNGRPSRAQARALGESVAGGDAVEGGASSKTITETKSYQFSRGRKEDSWKASQRLASEVAWRLFMVGNSLYYMSEEQLYNRRPRYAVGPDHDGVLGLTYDIDWNRPVSEASLQVTLARWGAPPGSVILLDGFGPPDGRWLVTGVSRDYFAPTAEVKLVQPGKAKLEPAAETRQRTVRGPAAAKRAGGSGDVTGVWPGKFAVSGAFGTDRGDHIHSGLDVSVPAGTDCIAPFDGTVTMANTSGFGVAGGMLHLRADQDVGTQVKRGDKVGWGHIGSCRVTSGKVKAGTVLGKSNGSPAHVHFVLIRQGAGGNGVDGNTDPSAFLRRVGSI